VQPLAESTLWRSRGWLIIRGRARRGDQGNWGMAKFDSEVFDPETELDLGMDSTRPRRHKIMKVYLGRSR
jgi:hypothetical protein